MLFASEGTTLNVECYGSGALSWLTTANVTIAAGPSGSVYTISDPSRAVLSLRIPNLMSSLVGTYTCVSDLLPGLESSIFITNGEREGGKEGGGRKRGRREGGREGGRGREEGREREREKERERERESERERKREEKEGERQGGREVGREEGELFLQPHTETTRPLFSPGSFKAFSHLIRFNVHCSEFILNVHSILFGTFHITKMQCTLRIKKIMQPHCRLYSINYLFNMAASLAILITLVFWLSIVRLHCRHKMAKIRGTASTRIHNRVLGE